MAKTKTIKTAPTPSIDVKTAITNRFPVGCLEDRNLKTLLNFAKACDILANLPEANKGEFCPQVIYVPTKTIQLMCKSGLVEYSRTSLLKNTFVYQNVIDPTDIIHITKTTKRIVYKTIDTDYRAIAEYIRNYIKSTL